jgi:prevent-host-death family protein
MEVGIRELKRRLSDYVDQASRGEIIQVTDRGRPKAILAPLPGRGRLEHRRGLDTSGQWEGA